MWQSVEMQTRRISVLTAPRFEVVSDNSPLAAAQYPHLKRIAAAADEAQVQQFHEIGVKAVIERGNPHGSHVAAAVLTEMGCDATKVAEWMEQSTARVAARAVVPPAVAA